MRGVVVVLAGLLVGCSSLTQVVKAPPQPVELTTLFFYPVTVTGLEATPARGFELSQRSLDRALQEAEGRLAFFGPSEFRVLRPDIENAWVATDALPLLVKSGGQPEQGAIVRLVVERRVTSSAMQTETSSGQTRARTDSEETTWLVRGELFHPSSATTLVEVGGEVKVEPGDTPPPEADYDDAPQLTALLERVTAAVIRHALGLAARRTGEPGTARFAATPAALSFFGGDEADKRGMDLEIALLHRARLLAPSAPIELAGAFTHAPPGTAVLVGDEKLQAGDVVLFVDGKPALPHTLARVRFRGAPVRLDVRRAAGATDHLSWP